MTLSQDIKEQISIICERNRDLYMMNREEIFLFLADITAISDQLTNIIYDLDIKIGQIKESVIMDHMGEKITASLLECFAKGRTSELTAEKDWAKTQLALLNSIRIAALAAQRSSE